MWKTRKQHHKVQMLELADNDFKISMIYKKRIYWERFILLMRWEYQERQETNFKVEILGLKTKIFKIKNSLDELNSKFGITEEKTMMEKCIPHKY